MSAEKTPRSGSPRLRGDRLPMTQAHHTPYLSPSRLTLYRECPALYYQRYVLKILEPPTIDMEYGQSIHRGLEAHFLSQDAELAFLVDLKARVANLPGCDPADWLVPQGINLMAAVKRLGYSGQPERRFIFAHAGFSVPFRGIMDLWDKRRTLVVDWKTTRRQWGDETPARYALQRAIYTRAIESEFHRPATFQFVALGAYPGGIVQVVEATPTEQDMAEAFDVALDIHLGIESEDWTCTCRDHRHQFAA